MKKLLLAAIIAAPFAYGMDESSMRTCNEITQINPAASPALFTQLAGKLKNAGLSTCSCIRAFNTKRIEDTKPAIEKEWGITDKHWNDIEEFVQKSTQEDMKPIGLEFIPAAETGPDGQTALYSIEEQNFLLKRFMESGYRNNKVKLNFQKPSMWQDEQGRYIVDSGTTNTARSIEASDYPIDHANNRLKYEIIEPQECIVSIGHDYEKFNKEGRKGLLLHEIYGHALHRDSLRGSLAFWSTAIKRPDMLEKQELFGSSDSITAFTCATEARADQFPAACTSVKNARLIESWLQQSHDDKKPQANQVKDPTHDDSKTRLAMATRIRKLKEAEEQLEKDERDHLRFVERMSRR